MPFNCSNPEDNQLLSDKCISINDGPTNAWWMSPDIILNDTRDGIQSSASIPSGASPDTAIQGANNQVTVRAHKSCNPSNSTDVVVELYVAHPGLVFTPTVNSLQIFQAVIPNDNFNPSAHVTQPWLADHAIPSPQPDPDPKRVHRCLIARCYPDNLTASQEKFCVLEDQHQAQRNIAIVAAQGKNISFFIQTANPNLEFMESATIRTIADLYPSIDVIDTILPSLKQFEGFRQITQTAPAQFALNVPDKFSPIIRDSSRPDVSGVFNPKDIGFQDIWQYSVRDGFNIGRLFKAVFNPTAVLQEAITVQKFNAPLKLLSFQRAAEFQPAAKLNISKNLLKLVEKAVPTFEADIKLPPQEVAGFTFNAELPEDAQPGDAHIFHIMHINENQQVIGGFTLVAVTTV